MPIRAGCNHTRCSPAARSAAQAALIIQSRYVHLQANSSAALRVHAVRVERFANLTCSPYDSLHIKRTLSGGLLHEMREACIAWLAAPLGGDLLAGELLLLQLVSRYARTQAHQALLL